MRSLRGTRWRAPAIGACPSRSGRRGLFPQSTPEQEGFSRAKLDALKDRVAARNTTSLLIIRHDKIVYKWYAPGWGPSRPHGTASLAKQLVGGMSLLVALNDGRIAVDDLASQYIPAWNQDPKKSKITIRQLATHSSGIEDAEEGGKDHMQLPGWKGAFWKRTPDPFSIAIHDAPVIFPPGTSFAYSNPGMAALAYAITASLRDAPQTDIRTLLEERIMDPLGIPASDWSIGYGRPYEVDGLNLYANWGGAQFTPRAAARVGQFMLHDGVWQGRQLAGREWVKKMITGVEPVPQMGLCWWTNTTGVWPKVPRDAFLGSGHHDQLLFVVPSLDLIVVRNGDSLDEANENARAEYVFTPVVEALVPQPPPYPPSQIIRSVTFDWRSHLRRAPGSDNWPLTWADDDNLYGAWGDGGGFDGTDALGRVSLGMARIQGPWNDYHGFNVWGGKNAEHTATFHGKSYGVICVDGMLYMWVLPQLEGGGAPRYKAEARLFQSRDHGVTWTPASWSFTRAEELDNAPTICQFGRNYAGRAINTCTTTLLGRGYRTASRRRSPATLILPACRGLVLWIARLMSSLQDVMPAVMRPGLAM